MLMNEPYDVAPPIGLRVKGKSGMIYECTGFENFRRQDGNDITLSVWTSQCRVCGTPIRATSVVWVTDVDRMVKNCPDHKGRRK